MAAGEECPSRRMSSLVVVPVAAVNVAPMWRNPCGRTDGNPMAGRGVVCEGPRVIFMSGQAPTSDRHSLSASRSVPALAARPAAAAEERDRTSSWSTVASTPPSTTSRPST